MTVESYVAAGGGVITDLFQTESESYLTDPALLDRLANEKLEREANAVRQEGWSWVEIVPDLVDLNTSSPFEQVRGKRQPLPARQAKALAKLERERDELNDCDELTDDQAGRLEALDAEIAALSNSAVKFSDRQKARAGAVVSVDYRGKLVVTRGLMRPEGVTAKTPSNEETETGETEQVAAPPCFSSALATDLVAHRTAALRTLYREKGLTLDQLMAFTVTDDHAAQEAPEWQRSPHSRAGRPPRGCAGRARACAGLARVLHRSCRQRPRNTRDSALSPCCRHRRQRCHEGDCRSTRRMGWPVARGRGRALGLDAGAGGRDRHRALGLLCRLHREAGSGRTRRPPRYSCLARHEAMVAAERGGVSRARSKDAHP